MFPKYRKTNPERKPLAQDAHPDRCKHCNGLGQGRWWDYCTDQICAAECRFCLWEDLHPLTLEPVQRDGLEDDFEWTPPVEILEANVPPHWRHLYGEYVDREYYPIDDLGTYRSGRQEFCW